MVVKASRRNTSVYSRLVGEPSLLELPLTRRNPCGGHGKVTEYEIVSPVANDLVRSPRVIVDV